MTLVLLCWQTKGVCGLPFTVMFRRCFLCWIFVSALKPEGAKLAYRLASIRLQCGCVLCTVHRCIPQRITLYMYLADPWSSEPTAAAFCFIWFCYDKSLPTELSVLSCLAAHHTKATFHRCKTASFWIDYLQQSSEVTRLAAPSKSFSTRAHLSLHTACHCAQQTCSGTSVPSVSPFILPNTMICMGATQDRAQVRPIIRLFSTDVWQNQYAPHI